MICAAIIIAIGSMLVATARGQEDASRHKLRNSLAAAFGSVATGSGHGMEKGKGAKPFNSIPARERNNAAFDLTMINSEVVKEFENIWRLVNTGIKNVEGMVLIFRNGDGSYTAESQGFSNEYLKFSFRWNPAAIAVVHTHPNRKDARPSLQDMRLADKFGVPVCTITNRGMFRYDPATKNTTRVMRGTDWIDPVKWQQLSEDDEPEAWN